MTSDSLIQFLPHRPPMIWVQNDLKIIDSQTSLIRVQLKKDLPYWSATGIFFSAALIELMAQATALHFLKRFANSSADTTESEGRGTKLTKAFLVGLNHLRVEENLMGSKIIPGEFIEIQIKIDRVVATVSIIDATAIYKDQRIAQGSLKLFGSTD